MQKSQEKRETFMELTPQILIVVLPLIFLGGFVDSVAGGGGLITLPAYLMAGIPAPIQTINTGPSAILGRLLSTTR